MKERIRQRIERNEATQWLSQKEVAERLGWSLETFRHARYAGRLRGLKIYRFGHRSYRIAEADLEAFIEQRRVDNYEPPQSLAQRTMVITAEDPDFA